MLQGLGAGRRLGGQPAPPPPRIRCSNTAGSPGEAPAGPCRPGEAGAAPPSGAGPSRRAPGLGWEPAPPAPGAGCSIYPGSLGAYPCGAGARFPGSGKRRASPQPARAQKGRAAYGTRDSQAVSHPGTSRARDCLASEIGRDRVQSVRSGRRQEGKGRRGGRRLARACVTVRQNPPP